MVTRFWGTAERPYTSYSVGYLHDAYEWIGTHKIQIKEDVQFYEINNKLINKYAGRINI